MKTYRGSAAAARHYVEADRGRADDNYLTEGTCIAELYAASPDTGVRRLQPLTGEAYEAWVAGFDPETGEPKGRLCNDDQAVRFVQVVVNGPKSWSDPHRCTGSRASSRAPMALDEWFQTLSTPT